jgi:mono/diheme cytochrome c family protein
VFLGVPGMKPVMQLRVGWSLATADGLAFEENAYTTPYELAKFDPRAEGFGDIAVDLTPRAAAAAADAGPASLAEGQRLAQLFACVACHATEPNPMVVKNGPVWKGLYGSERTVFAGGKPVKVTVDDAYVREAILDPSAKIAAGYEKSEYAMPSFAGVLTPTQVDSLVLYVKSLK